VGTFHDLHSLRAAEKSLLRLKDLYSALIQTDQLIIHAPDQQSLFRDICTIATKQAKFTLAWVGLVDPQTQLVQIAAAEGPTLAFPDGFSISAAGDQEIGHGPTATCIREGTFQIVNDFLADKDMKPWLGLAGELGLRSAASFPLWKENLVIGALTLYSQQPGFFDPDRVELLNEMAQDISFALDHLAMEEGRQATETALRESEANLAKAQEIAQMGSWIWDVAKNHGEWSIGMEKIYGIPSPEGAGHLERVLHAIHPEDRIRYQSRILKLITHGGTLECDYRVLRPDGEERVFVVHVVAEPDAEGHTALLHGITQDITERRRAEEKIRETLRYLEDLKAAVDESAVVLLTDAKGRITYVNRRMCEISGYTLAELTGKNPRVMSSHYHPQAFFREMWEIISAGGIWRGEVKNRAKNGSYHWLDTTVVPFLDEGGNPIQFMAIRFDITDRKLAEEKVTAISSERMALLDAASVAKVVPWSMDLATGNLRMGDSALLVLGKPALAFHAHPNALRELLKVDDQQLLIHAQTEARAGLLGSFEAPLKRGEKQIIWTRWTIGRREGFLHGVVQDITEQHELYSQLLQSQKLESLGTLVSGINHDFNNILMGILGYTEVLSAMTDLPPSVQKGIGVIQRAAERGRGLVNQLLRFSRRSVATKVPHNLNDIAREVESLMQLPGDNRIELQLQLDLGLPDILMDPGQINQVAMNLAVNARDAIAGRGIIYFRTGLTSLEPGEAAELDKRPGPYQFLEVEDTGAGINPEFLSRIFEPFFTTKGVGKGTGLGLSVVHGIVEAHKGHIQCQSVQGEGTRFRVLLPQITSDSLSQDLGHPATAQSDHRILLLDDEGDSRSTAMDLLTYMGNQVLAESDCQRAIEAHRREPFQLAIVNLELGEGAGIRMLKALQEAIPEVPIIAGADREVTELKRLKRQPQAMVQWPFRAVELLSAIHRIIG
jgi:PAS domain S-box-containing protein